MKIGITGASGQLGALVINSLKLKTDAKNIVALVRAPEKAASLGVEVRKFEYNSPAELTSSLEGIDKLLIISGNEIGQRARQHKNVIEAARQASVKLLVYTSLLHADTSTLVLAAEHLETEKDIINSGIPYTILRNGWYTENYAGLINGATASGTLLGSSGDGRISSAARVDFAEAAAVVLTSEGHTNKTYELAGDEAYTMNEMALTIAKLTNKPTVYKNITADEFAAALTQTGLPEGIARFLAGTHLATEKGDLFDDSRQLSSLIGKPTTSLEKVITQLTQTAN